LLRKYKTYVGEIRKFALHFPGIKSMSKLPSGTTAAIADEGTRGG